MRMGVVVLEQWASAAAGASTMAGQRTQGFARFEARHDPRWLPFLSARAAAPMTQA
jgi:hypothetical protein